MKFNDATKYAIKNINNRKIKTAITIIILTFLNFIMLLSISIGINTKSSVKTNYLKSFQKNGYEIIVNGMFDDTNLYQYTQIQNQMDKNSSNISLVYSYCSDILFYDFKYSNIELPFEFKNSNDIILTSDYMEDYSVGDEFDYTIRAYNSIASVSFNVIGFSEELESPVADLNYLVHNINIDEFYISFTANRKLNINDLNKTYNLYNFINKMEHSYVTCEFLDGYGPNIKKATLFETAAILIALILMISMIFTILNILISNFNSDKVLYANILVLGEHKKNIAKIATFDIILNIFISTFFSTIIEFLISKPIRKIIKIFVEFIFRDDITFLAIDKIYINSRTPLYIPFIIFIFNSIIILLCLFIKFKSLYKKGTATLMKEVSEWKLLINFIFQIRY